MKKPAATLVLLSTLQCRVASESCYAVVQQLGVDYSIFNIKLIAKTVCVMRDESKNT